jgi:hypothetical protein
MTGYALSESSSGTGLWGDIALAFSGSPGTGASASATGSGAPSLTITTTQNHSAIAVLVLDADANNGSSRAWLTVNGVTPSAGNGYEQVYSYSASEYAAYVAYYPDAGAAGAQTVGLSAPSMQYTILAVEVLGGAATTPALFYPATQIRQHRPPRRTPSMTRGAQGAPVIQTGALAPFHPLTSPVRQQRPARRTPSMRSAPGAVWVFTPPPPPAAPFDPATSPTRQHRPPRPRPAFMQGAAGVPVTAGPPPATGAQLLLAFPF